MRYSNYLSSKIKESGLPRFSVGAFQKFMNVVHLEGKIEGIKNAQKNEQLEPHKYDMTIFSVSKQLTMLTGNLPPEKFIHELISGQR